MPIDEMVEFGVRAGLEAAGPLIEVAGQGRSRLAAGLRALMWLAATVMCAGLLWLMLQPERTGSPIVLAISGALTAAAGAWLAMKLTGEVRLLRFWGEPNISMTDKGLVIPGHLPIAWTDIVSITADRRRRRGLVHIVCTGTRRRNVMIPSSKPEALAKALLAEKGRQP
ncbi:hypothetical protein [Sandarakinorhabdus rubra]|uniref:hypothetical protein n=1 Tax=Sandarakinorhabdus rubra TaxID=2672568 RepID=UPI0013D957C3|nr:hypothetical protein [Sandarakinorhabdus rubra]